MVLPGNSNSWEVFLVGVSEDVVSEPGEMYHVTPLRITMVVMVWNKPLVRRREYI